MHIPNSSLEYQTIRQKSGNKINLSMLSKKLNEPEINFILFSNKVAGDTISKNNQLKHVFTDNNFHQNLIKIQLSEEQFETWRNLWTKHQVIRKMLNILLENNLLNDKKQSRLFIRDTSSDSLWLQSWNGKLLLSYWRWLSQQHHLLKN